MSRCCSACAAVTMAVVGLGVLVSSTAEDLPPASIWTHGRIDVIPRWEPGGRTVERLYPLVHCVEGGPRVTSIGFQERPTLLGRIVDRLGLAQPSLRLHFYGLTDQSVGDWVRFDLDSPADDPERSAKVLLEQLFRQP